MRDLFRAVSWRRFWERDDAEALAQKFFEGGKASGAPLGKDHPLTRWVDEHPHGLRFLPVGYRRLGKPMMHRPGMRQTLTEIPHVYVETVYGVHAWKFWGKRDESAEIPWWAIRTPEVGSVFYAVGD